MKPDGFGLVSMVNQRWKMVFRTDRNQSTEREKTDNLDLDVRQCSFRYVVDVYVTKKGSRSIVWKRVIEEKTYD